LEMHYLGIYSLRDSEGLLEFQVTMPVVTSNVRM